MIQMIAVWLHLFTSFGFAQACDKADKTCAMDQEPLTAFFKTADPCHSKNLLDISTSLCGAEMGLMKSTLPPISVDRLDLLSSEMVRPLRSNKFYRSHLSRPELAKFLKDLSSYLKGKGVKSLSCGDLNVAAFNAYSRAKSEERIGECYQVRTFGGAKYLLGEVAREISVSPAEQKKIESLLSQSNKPYHFMGQRDSVLMLNGRLTLNDLKELRAIRAASAHFEQATPLRNDKAGGFWSNLKGEITGGDQLNCIQEASTHLGFLRALEQKGLIKNFEVMGTIERPASDINEELWGTGHVAVRLRSRKTGQEVVYDSWFEKGGEAAHILLPEDWRRLSLVFKNEFLDLVPFEPSLGVQKESSRPGTK